MIYIRTEHFTCQIGAPARQRPRWCKLEGWVDCVLCNTSQIQTKREDRLLSGDVYNLAAFFFSDRQNIATCTSFPHLPFLGEGTTPAAQNHALRSNSAHCAQFLPIRIHAPPSPDKLQGKLPGCRHLDC